ncbi:MAG: MarR family transcriptional regulator [Frankiaceae bacterium]|nr:MarR family transcriptional regulator [Frankiaceae bacterium]
MTARDEPELDFLTFPDEAVREAGRRLPELDLEAMRLVLLLHRVSSAVVYDLESGVHRPAGWSWSGFRLLFALWIAGPLDGTTAATLSGMSRAAVSNLAKTLDRDGLVRRAADPADARAVVLSLTEAGESALRSTFRAHNARETAWAGALEPAERATLVALLGKLADAAHSDGVRRRG